jgi:hypothetical protein
VSHAHAHEGEMGSHLISSRAKSIMVVLMQLWKILKSLLSGVESSKRVVYRGQVMRASIRSGRT